MKKIKIKVTTETRREEIKDAIRQSLEGIGIDRDTAYEEACRVADDLEGSKT